MKLFLDLFRLIKMVGKKYYPVRGKKLDKIIQDIKNQ